MDLFKKIKLWRGIGRVLDTKMGAHISDAIGQPVNRMASLAVSANNDDIPWSPFVKSLADSCITLVSTAGFYLEGDDPFDVDSAHGDASFRTIPSSSAKNRLKIAHTHYSHTRVKEDINVLFPIDRLSELADAKVIGRLAPNFYSFGFGGDLVKAFIGPPEGSAHKLARKLKSEKVDGVLMIPA